MYMGCLRAALFLRSRVIQGGKNEAGRGALARRAAMVGLCLAVGITGWISPFARTAARVRRDTLRLHVRAAGDSWQDLQVKYRVRDAILEQAGALFAPAAGEGEAADRPRPNRAARRAERFAGQKRDDFAQRKGGRKGGRYADADQFEKPERDNDWRRFFDK